MIERHLESEFKKALAEYPVVTLFGPRQSGKTTLARMCCKGFSYVTLEDKETRDLAMSDYKVLFSRYKRPMIIDEIQRVPELASAVQVLVDADREKCGQFVLTGSQQNQLAEAIDESLAGRTSVLELLPLSYREVSSVAHGLSTDELLLRGFMPELYRTNKDPTSYYRNYFRTYVERDVRRIVNVKDVILFERFVTLLAGRTGQFVNFASLADETGVSATTIANWMSILEASFLIFRLPPYFTNVSKRLVKSPKIYFTEVGLACYLLGLESPEQVAWNPLRGNLFENLVIAEARKSFTNRGRDPRMSVYHTAKGFEVDLVLTKGTQVRPIEVKSAQTFNPALVRNLKSYVEQDASARDPLLVYDGEPIELFGPAGVQAANFRDVVF